MCSSSSTRSGRASSERMPPSRKPATLSKPMRPSRMAASRSRPGWAITTIGRSRASSVPAQVAKLPPRPTLTLPRRWAPAKSAGSRVSSTCAPSSASCEHRVDRQRRELLVERLLQRAVLLRVEHGVVAEVVGRVRLVGRHDPDELVALHRLEGVVGAPLLADRRHRLLRQVLAAQRARAVRRVHERLVGQGQQLGVQRVVEQRAELLGGPAQRRAQVGPADVADEERVAR